jgi:hypothetical protein
MSEIFQVTSSLLSLDLLSLDLLSLDLLSLDSCLYDQFHVAQEADSFQQ